MIVKKSASNFKEVGKMKINEYSLNEKFSAALIEINGHHGRTKSTKEDRIYYILKGNGTFEISGKESEVIEGDTILIEKNTPYDIKGKMTFFMICTPKFDATHDMPIN